MKEGGFFVKKPHPRFITKKKNVGIFYLSRLSQKKKKIPFFRANVKKMGEMGVTP